MKVGLTDNHSITNDIERCNRNVRSIQVTTVTVLDIFIPVKVEWSAETRANRDYHDPPAETVSHNNPCCNTLNVRSTD